MVLNSLAHTKQFVQTESLNSEAAGLEVEEALQ